MFHVKVLVHVVPVQAAPRVWSVPSMAKMTLSTPVPVALNCSDVTAALVIVAGAGEVIVGGGEVIVKELILMPTFAPLELSIVLIAICPLRRPPQLSWTVMRLRSSGWLSPEPASPSLGSSMDVTVALSV